MKTILIITDKVKKIQKPYKSYRNNYTIETKLIDDNWEGGDYRNIKNRNYLMNTINEFINIFPKSLYLHGMINPVDIIRYSLFFKIEKYFQLIRIFNHYSAIDNLYGRIVFDLSNNYDNFLVYKLFEGDKKAVVRGGNFLKSNFILAALTLKDILTIFVRLVKPNKKTKNKKLIDSPPSNKENFVFVESSKNGLSFSKLLAEDRVNQSTSMLFTPNKDIASEGYKEFDHIEFANDFIQNADFLKSIIDTIRLLIYPLRKNNLTNTKEFKLFFLFMVRQLGSCSLNYYSCYHHFNKYTPSLILSASIVNDFVRSYMMLGEKHNKKGILVQHGIMHTFEFEKYITQNYFILWGEYNKDQLVKTGFTPENIFVTGSPKYEKNKTKVPSSSIKPKKSTKVIYFAPNTGGAYVSYNEARVMLQSVIKACASIKDIKLSIKSHPRDKSSLFKNLPSEIVKFDSPECLIDSHDIVITSTSTTGIEACCMDKDLIILEPQTPEVTEFYKAFNAALVVKKKPEQLKEALDKLISNENNIQSELQNGRRKLIDSMFNGMKPGSVERMVEDLQKIIAIEN